jgi:hypothetical protein
MQEAPEGRHPPAVPDVELWVLRPALVEAPIELDAVETVVLRMPEAVPVVPASWLPALRVPLQPARVSAIQTIRLCM